MSAAAKPKTSAGVASDRIDFELKQIARKSGGLLRPADVVRFARNPATALHGKFEWDDTKAAQQHRLWQAREIINYRLVLVQEGREPARRWHSLPSQRAEDGGGYHDLKTIMDNPAFRAELLQEAKNILLRAKERYQFLDELADVWASIRKNIG